MKEQNVQELQLVIDKFYTVHWKHKNRQYNDFMAFKKRSQNLLYFQDKNCDWLVINYKDIISIS